MPHKYKRINFALATPRLHEHMFEDLCNLGMACRTAYCGHCFQQNLGVRGPGHGFELTVTPVVRQLYFKAAECCGLLEHLSIGVVGEAVTR